MTQQTFPLLTNNAVFLQTICRIINVCHIQTQIQNKSSLQSHSNIHISLGTFVFNQLLNTYCSSTKLLFYIIQYVFHIHYSKDSWKKPKIYSSHTLLFTHNSRVCTVHTVCKISKNWREKRPEMNAILLYIHEKIQKQSRF